MINYKDELLKAFYEICEKAKREGYENGEANGIDKMNGMVKEAYQHGLEDAWECAGKIHNMYYQKLNEVFPDCTHDKIFIDYSAQGAIQKIKEYEQQKQDEKCEKCTKEISAECVIDGCEFEPKQGEKNCRNCGQPRDYKGRCIPFIEGKCIKVRTGWIPKQTDDTDIDDGSIKVGDEIYSDETDMTAVVHHIDAWGRYQCFNENGAQFVLDKETYDEYWHKTYKYYPQIAEVLKQLRGENE